MIERRVATLPFVVPVARSPDRMTQRRGACGRVPELEQGGVSGRELDPTRARSIRDLGYKSPIAYAYVFYLIIALPPIVSGGAIVSS